MRRSRQFSGTVSEGRERAVQHVYPRRPRCRQIDGTVRPPKVWMAESSYGGGKLTPPAIPGLGLRGGASFAPPRWCRFGTTGGLSPGVPNRHPRRRASTQHRCPAVSGRPTVVEIPHRRRTLIDLWCRYVTSPLTDAQGFIEKVRGASCATGEPHDSRPKDRVEDVGGDDIDLFGGDDVAVAGDHLVRVPEQS